MTQPYGEMEIAENQIFQFSDGIFGFEYVTRFAVLDGDEDSPFKWLQAVGEPLAFVILQPEYFLDSYDLKVPQSDLESIEAANPDSLLVFTIVTIPENPEDMTANLQGPVILNPASGKGIQAISLNDAHTVKHRIIDGIAAESPGR